MGLKAIVIVYPSKCWQEYTITLFGIEFNVLWILLAFIFTYALKFYTKRGQNTRVADINIRPIHTLTAFFFLKIPNKCILFYFIFKGSDRIWNEQIMGFHSKQCLFSLWILQSFKAFFHTQLFIIIYNACVTGKSFHSVLTTTRCLNTHYKVDVIVKTQRDIITCSRFRS